MWWGYEAIIYFSLFFGGIIFLEIIFHLPKKRAGQKKKIFLSLVAFFLALGWLAVFYGSFIEPRLLFVRHETIVLSDNPIRELKVAVLSDLHVGHYKKTSWAQAVTQTINEQKPDLIFLLGDFVFDRATDADMLASLLALQAPLGVYAVSGNHDFDSGALENIKALFKTADIRFLDNTSAELPLAPPTLTLVGVADLWFGGDPSFAMAKVNVKKGPVIFLAHNPDVVLDPTVKPADLVIAGHTHGGQIRLPWLGSLAEIPDRLGQQYDRGLFDYHGQKLFITSGAGETGPRARLFVPPEIVILKLRF